MLSWLAQLFGFSWSPRAGRPLLSARRFEASSHQLRATLDERYAAMKSAMAAEDAEATLALLTPGFVSINVSGRRINGRQMAHAVPKLKIDRSKRVAKTTLVDIEERDGEATVLQHYAMTSTPDAPISMPRELQALSRDVWQNSGNEWFLAKTETLEVERLDTVGPRRHVISRAHRSQSGQS